MEKLEIRKYIRGKENGKIDCKRYLLLAQKSEPATKEDLHIGQDLEDTLAANRERCVGMAANMIGVKKNIIIINMGFVDADV